MSLAIVSLHEVLSPLRNRSILRSVPNWHRCQRLCGAHTRAKADFSYRTAARIKQRYRRPPATLRASTITIPFQQEQIDRRSASMRLVAPLPSRHALLERDGLDHRCGDRRNHPHSCRLAVSAAGGPQHARTGVGKSPRVRDRAAARHRHPCRERRYPPNGWKHSTCQTWPPMRTLALIPPHWCFICPHSPSGLEEL